MNEWAALLTTLAQQRNGFPCHNDSSNRQNQGHEQYHEVSEDLLQDAHENVARILEKIRKGA